jgi:hypothetical protein
VHNGETELRIQLPSSHPLTAPVHPPERVTGPPELHHSKGRYRDASCTVRPELAGELIEQQQQRQPALGGFAPAAQLAGDGLAGEAQESLPQQRISCR